MNHVRHIRKEYLLDELSRFVSSRSGIIQATYFIREKNSFLQIPNAISEAMMAETGIGYGLDLDAPTAMIKSLAETVERYALVQKANSAVLYNKSMKDLKSMGYSCFYPDYDMYEDFVYKNSRFIRMTPALKTDWVATGRFSDDKMIWLPISFMYCVYSPNKIFKFPNTNGMSCSFFDSAVEDSILELIERDTFLYMWLAKNPGEEILFDKIRYQPLAELLDILDFKRKQIKVIYKRTDIQIPCIFVIFKGKRKYNEAAFSIAGSADFDIERGCYRALLEFASFYNTFSVSLALHKKKYEEIYKKIKISKNDFKIKNFFDRTVFYTMYENFSKCEFLFNVKGYKKLSELFERWSRYKGNKKAMLRSCLRDKEVFILDVTPKEVEGSDVRVVRSYSPDLLDLEAGENLLYSSVFKRRRVDMIDRMFNKRTKTLNTDPHCYS